MAFVQAMKLGINGAEVYTEKGVGDYRVTLFTMLNRGLEEKYIEDSVAQFFNRDISSTLSNELRDLYVMTFQTRDVRGGKGEKLLFYQLIAALYKHDKETVSLMIRLIPEYGCWRDLWELHKRIPELESVIIEFTRESFQLDFAKFQVNKPLSLLSKWLPREKSVYKGLAQKLADAIYNLELCSRKRIIMYRKDVSMMNKYLKTVEVNMCGGAWASINPEAVPGRCLKDHTKAFLNKKLTCDEIRYPYEDRIECREHFKEFIEDLKTGKKAHGANVIMPHELVAKAMKRDTSLEEHAINQAQWESIRNETLRLGGLGKSIAMCDFSGSMDGIPKLVSLALGILISEITHDSFKDTILTFESRPTWHSFTGTLKEKLDSIGDISQGTSTDFYYACMCIIKKMKEHKVPIGEEPEDLIVLTDMGFDEVIDEVIDKQNKWSTQIQDIREEYKKAGEEVWGLEKAWKPPRIIIWNIRAAFKDFHATAHEEGVVQLSGWSSSMLKALQNGIYVNTPYEGFRTIIDNPRYDKVRDIFERA